MLLNKPIEEVRRILSLNEHIASLDAPLDIDPSHTIAELIADESTGGDPESMLQIHELDVLVEAWLSQLTDRQRQVIDRRYGLHGMEVATLDVIATDLGVTRERVRQIQVEGLDHLRKIIKHDGVVRDALL